MTKPTVTLEFDALSVQHLHQTIHWDGADERTIYVVTHYDDGDRVAVIAIESGEHEVVCIEPMTVAAYRLRHPAVAE